MREDNKQWGAPRRLWAARRSFRGFGLLLFYCHMLMLFSLLARLKLAGLPECAPLLEAGRMLVPALFALTTFSLFFPRLFWLGLALGLAHIPFAAIMLAGAPLAAFPWFAALGGLLALLALAARFRLSG